MSDQTRRGAPEHFGIRRRFSGRNLPPLVLRAFGAHCCRKGICRNLEATLIKDWKSMCNLDSTIHLPGFVCFTFQLSHFLCGDFFDTIGQSRHSMHTTSTSALPSTPEIIAIAGNRRDGPQPVSLRASTSRPQFPCELTLRAHVGTSYLGQEETST